MYGREFTLACDFEPVHWMASVINPGARLTRWRLRLRDYQYNFEYKKGKLNTRVQAISEIPPVTPSSDSESFMTLDTEEEEGTSSESSIPGDTNYKTRVLPIKATHAKKPNATSISNPRRTKSETDDGNNKGIKIPVPQSTSTTKRGPGRPRKQPSTTEIPVSSKPGPSILERSTIASRLRLKKIKHNCPNQLLMINLHQMNPPQSMKKAPTLQYVDLQKASFRL